MVVARGLLQVFQGLVRYLLSFNSLRLTYFFYIHTDSGGKQLDLVENFFVVSGLEPQHPASYLFAERNSNFISSLGGVLDDEVVERSQAGWNLVATLLCCSSCTAVMLLRHWAERSWKSSTLKDMNARLNERLIFPHFELMLLSTKTC